MIEVEGIIKNRAKLPFKGFINLAREGNTFYILANNKIYKGNPRKNWTEIADITDISNNKTIVTTEWLEDGLKIFLYSKSEAFLYIYKISNKLTTLLQKIKTFNGFDDSNTYLPNFYVLNNTIYQVGFVRYVGKVFKNSSSNELTEITDQIKIEGNIHLNRLAEGENPNIELNRYLRFYANNKLYNVTTMNNYVEFCEFDGANFKFLKNINAKEDSQFKYCTRDRILQIGEKEAYIALFDDLAGSYESYYDTTIFNEDMNIINNLKTTYQLGNRAFFCINENNNYEYITREHKYDKDYNLVEFPIKAYVKRE